MKVHVRLFAQQRQLTGWRERTIDLPEGSRVSTAWDALVSEWPVLAPGTDSVRFARNAVYADADELLAEGDEVAVIPPVAGGSGLGHSPAPWTLSAERLPKVSQPDLILKLPGMACVESPDVAVRGYFGAANRREQVASPAPEVGDLDKVLLVGFRHNPGASGGTRS